MNHDEPETAFRHGGPPFRPASRSSEPKPSFWWRLPRAVAALLALGGCFWGMLLSPWFFTRDVTPTAIAVLGPGYLITVAYIIRANTTPSFGTRRFIWAASLLVQGLWLAFATWVTAADVLNGRSLGPILLLAWWVFATVASAFGLVTERESQNEPS